MSSRWPAQLAADSFNQRDQYAGENPGHTDDCYTQLTVTLPTQYPLKDGQAEWAQVTS